jgi:hypothetical protein
MRIVTIVVLTAAAAVLAGCVSPQVTKPSPTTVDLRRFHRVKLVVTDAVNSPYSREGVPMFEGLLKGKLQALGYTLVESGPEMVVGVTVHEFNEGNRTLRTIVGFGAGRAVLKFTAGFRDASGELIAELEGGKSYHGMEFGDNPTFKSDESTRMGLISYSVSQIGKFAQNSGRSD